MNIEEKFIQLTSHTYPHGTEDKLFDMLPSELEFDEYGNLFLNIGSSDVMFTSHLDTATSANTFVNHQIEYDSNIRMIKTDGKSILGADCKAGVVIMLYMIEKKVPGLYYFFLGEEVGCVGSKKVSSKHALSPIPGITKVVSFDRRGTGSVITFQSNGRCCSDDFGNALAEQLNLVDETFKYKLDQNGIYTDSAQFIRVYPECTNISVGYYSEHTFSERQDIDHLEKLAEACTKVDWSSLPVKRDKTVSEYKSYGGMYGYGIYDEWEDYYTDYSSNRRKWPSEAAKFDKKSSDNKEWFHDSEFNYVSHFIVDVETGVYKEVDLADGRISKEIEIISSFLEDIELVYSSIKWDGVSLTVNLGDERGVNVVNRYEMETFLTELDLTKVLESIDKNYDLKY